MIRSLAILMAGAALSAALAQETPIANPRDRAKAVRDFARSTAVDSKEKAARVGAYVRDPDLSVQRVAVEELARLGGVETVAPLVEATRINDETIQVTAVNGLVDFYYPGYVKRGLASLKAKLLPANDPMVEPHVEVNPDVIAAMARLTSSGVSLVSQANAARGLGVLRGQAGLDDLYQALRSKDTRVLYEALTAIRKIGDPAAGPRITYLLRDLDEEVLLAAIDANGYLKNRDALPRLRELASDSRKRVRPAAIAALAHMPEETDRGLYEGRLEDPDAAVKTAALEGLARLGRAEDVDRANMIFEKERKMEPRLAAAFAAVALGNRSLTEFAPLRYLSNTLNSAAWAGVAEGYLEELARGAEMRKALIALLPGMAREEKARVARLLGRTGAPDVEETLVTLSRDADVSVGQAAAQALRTLRSARASR